MQFYDSLRIQIHIGFDISPIMSLIQLNVIFYETAGRDKHLMSLLVLALLDVTALTTHRGVGDDNTSVVLLNFDGTHEDMHFCCTWTRLQRFRRPLAHRTSRRTVFRI